MNLRQECQNNVPLSPETNGRGYIAGGLKMTKPNSLYDSWIIEGSYMNNMLNCGNRYNQWVQTALCYLPSDVLDEHKENLVFYSTAERDGCRVARHNCENREVILLSDRVLPKQGANEGQPDVRYFIFTVLHETAHAIKKHKSPKFDNLSVEQNQAQEDEADNLALDWFNQHIKELNNKNQLPLTMSEVETAQQKSQDVMEKLYEGV